MCSQLSSLSPGSGQTSACQLVRGHCSVIVIIVSVVTSLSMEAETNWLASLNRQLTRTIVDLQTRLKIEAEDKERRSLKQLFSLGCGFTGAVLIMKSVKSLYACRCETVIQSLCSRISSRGFLQPDSQRGARMSTCLLRMEGFH